MRELRDAAGVSWLVYEIRPEHALPLRSALLPESHRAGWLCFESEREKRRLAPYPHDWESMPESALEQLVREASCKAAGL